VSIAGRRYHVDLVAEDALAIDDMCLGSLISPGQVRLQQLKPYFLAGISLGSGMAEALPDDFQLPLYLVVQAGKEYRERPVRHSAPS
jgi:hypothetical protein